MLHFNRSGLLLPNTNISSSLVELETEFVHKIPTRERIALLTSYMEYSRQLKEICGNIELMQWIDGSFVTRKKRPNDIDLVTFIDFRIILKHGADLDRFKYPESIIHFNVDAYIVAVYPENNNHHFLFKSDSAFWMDTFSRTRRDRSGKKVSKGFLEIKF